MPGAIVARRLTRRQKALMQHPRPARQAANPQVMRRPCWPVGRDTSSQPSRHREEQKVMRPRSPAVGGLGFASEPFGSACRPSHPHVTSPGPTARTVMRLTARGHCPGPRPVWPCPPATWSPCACRGGRNERCRPPPRLCRTRPRCLTDRLAITAVQGGSFSGFTRCSCIGTGHLARLLSQPGDRTVPVCGQRSRASLECT